jgi:predicted  nucleic acid-binding Zn-ribbon protein
LPEIKVAQATAPAESTVVADATSIGKAIKEGREALSAMPPSPEVEELRKKLSELATKKADAVLLKDLVPLVPQVTAIKAEIKTLSGRMKKVEDGLTAISRRLDDPETGLAMAHTKADAAHTRLDDRTNGLAAAHAKADKVSIAINDRVTGISALNERMEAVENDQGGVMQWVAILAAALLALAALLRTFLPKGEKEKVKTVPVSEATAPGKVDDPLDFGQTPRFAKSVTPGGKPLEPAPAV